MRARTLAALSALAGIASACDLAKLLETTSVQPAMIATADGTPDQVAVPDTVLRGVSFAVSINSHGSLCLKGADHTDVVYVADTAVIRPYDRISSGPCNGDALRVVLHTASIAFDRVGPAVVRFEGVKPAAGGGVTPMTVERAITVR